MCQNQLHLCRCCANLHHASHSWIVDEVPLGSLLPPLGTPDCLGGGNVELELARKGVGIAFQRHRGDKIEVGLLPDLPAWLGHWVRLPTSVFVACGDANAPAALLNFLGGGADVCLKSSP